MEQNNSYTQAVNSGKYEKTGLTRKYDNVRLYWEDALSRTHLRPHIDSLIEDRSQKLNRIRILDLGCGSGDGHDLLMGIKRKDPGINEHEVNIIQPEILGLYMGIDFNEVLLKQAEERFQGSGKIQFRKGDFSNGLPVDQGESPFDIYFTSYGTLSHNNDEQTVNLFSDIAKHAGHGALIVGDWLGRYSYEWQDLWDKNIDQEKYIEYVISYIYDASERDNVELDSFTLRLMSRDEVLRIVKKAEEKSGVKIKAKYIFDRSLFVGRHMDTKDYNQYTKPLRHIVNSLHEPNIRTNFESLILDYHPKPGFELINNFLERLQMCWNTLVYYTMDICASFDDNDGKVRDAPPIPGYYPESLKTSMNDIRRVVEGAGWFRMGDPRSNVIEPQLGYALRRLEIDFQTGQGYGHGLAGIFEVQKE